MHELPLTKSIFNSVVAKAEENGATSVTLVALEIGVLREFVPEIVQKYWNYVAKGSIAEGATIEIKQIPITAECRDCKTVYEVDLKHITEARCPKCACETGRMLTGRELRIIGIEIE